MLQQLLILWPVLVVLKQTVSDKGAKLCGESLVGGKARWIFLDHLRQHLELGLAVFVGELTGGKLHQGDPKAPHISPDVVVRFVLVEDGITNLASFKSFKAFAFIQISFKSDRISTTQGTVFHVSHSPFFVFKIFQMPQSVTIITLVFTQFNAQCPNHHSGSTL